MPVRKEDHILDDYLRAKNLKASHPRRQIADVFLRLERHVTVGELYEAVRRQVPRLGFATVYRTLKLLCDCGLARELRFDDGMSQYEHLYGHAHHDHLICTRCGKVVEAADESIEALQEKLFKKYDFTPLRHRMELYGICAACRGRVGKK